MIALFALFALLAFPAGVFIRRAFERSNVAESFRAEWSEWVETAIAPIVYARIVVRANVRIALAIVRARIALARIAVRSVVETAIANFRGNVALARETPAMLGSLARAIVAMVRADARKVWRNARKATGRFLKRTGKAIATFGAIVDGTRADALRKQKARAMAKASATESAPRTRKATPRKGKIAA